MGKKFLADLRFPEGKNVRGGKTKQSMEVPKGITTEANYINHTFTTGETGNTLTVRHKFTGEILARLPLGGTAEMETAIRGAEQAFEIMRHWSAGQRSEKLAALRNAFDVRKEEFISLITAEAGKPIAYATNEVKRCLVTLDTAVRETLRITGEMVPIDFDNGQGKTAFTQRFPIGPIAAISPFNFPLNLALHKIAPALATGCSVVLKPAPQAPLAALAFAPLLQAAGYPEGALNVLVCDVPVAQNLVTDERMKMLSFTGSPQVGWYLKNLAGRKKVTLELGGNAAVVIDATANLDKAAQNIAIGAFLYAGQICISTQRIYVDQAVYDAFREKLIVATEKLISGDPFDPNVINGPVIDKTHLRRIALWVREALDQGAELLTGGKVLDEAGNIYAPTLLTNTHPDMKVVSEEIFGPVAILEKVADFDEALHHVNASGYGLQAGVFTNRVDQMKKAHNTLEVGAVLINNIPGFRMDNMPYGGVKASGLGREGVRYAMEDMTEERLLVY